LKLEKYGIFFIFYLFKLYEYIAKYQNRYAVPLSSSLSLVGRESNERGVWRNEGMGMNRISWISIKAWLFDGFLLSQGTTRRVSSQRNSVLTDFCEPQRYLRPSSEGFGCVAIPSH